MPPSPVGVGGRRMGSAEDDGVWRGVGLGGGRVSASPQVGRRRRSVCAAAGRVCSAISASTRRTLQRRVRPDSEQASAMRFCSWSASAQHARWDRQACAASAKSVTVQSPAAAAQVCGEGPGRLLVFCDGDLAAGRGDDRGVAGLGQLRCTGSSACRRWRRLPAARRSSCRAATGCRAWCRARRWSPAAS